jgi:hypothetical protein
LEAGGDSLTIWSQEDNELVRNFHAKKAKDMANEDALATPEPTSTVAPAETIPVTNVVSAITGNRWTSDALIVSGTDQQEHSGRSDSWHFRCERI